MGTALQEVSYDPGPGLVVPDEVDSALDRALNVVEFPKDRGQDIDDAEDALDRVLDRVLDKDEAAEADPVEDPRWRERNVAILTEAQQKISLAAAKWQEMQAILQSDGEDWSHIQTDADVYRLSQDDPVGLMQWQVWAGVVQTMNAAQAYASQAQQTAFDQLAVFEDSQFNAKNPRWSAKDNERVGALLADAGVGHAEVEALWMTPLPINTNDPRVLPILEKAVRHRNAGRKLEGEAAVGAILRTLRDAGFTEQEAGAILSKQGFTCYMRDHRVRQLLVWASKGLKK